MHLIEKDLVCFWFGNSIFALLVHIQGPWVELNWPCRGNSSRRGDFNIFWVGSRSEKTPCYHVHRISCQSSSLQASAESTSSCLPVFIYNFSNTFPLHLIHSSMLDISKQFWIIDKANKWGAVRVWIYLFIIRKAHGHYV